MDNNMFTEIQFMVFNRIALAHTLIDNEYRYELRNIGYGIYGKTPKCGGIMEIGFVEQNPVILKGEQGEFTIEENGIFIIPPESRFSVSTKNPGLHRHTSVEFLGRFRTKPAEGFVPPVRKFPPERFFPIPKRSLPFFPELPVSNLRSRPGGQGY